MLSCDFLYVFDFGIFVISYAILKVEKHCAQFDARDLNVVDRQFSLNGTEKCSAIAQKKLLFVSFTECSKNGNRYPIYDYFLTKYREKETNSN